LDAAANEKTAGCYLLAVNFHEVSSEAEN
jgi:hypothetical protein